MLSAQCPSCGAPAPVSLATPDYIECPSCRHRGPPAPEVSAQLREAAALLWQLDAGDRQLSDAQRMNLRTARSSLLILFVVLGAVLLPLLFLAGGCVALFATADSFEPFSVILIACGILPFALGVTAAFLALRHVRRRGRLLEERCRALPPAGAGLPARCHVCGGTLSIEIRQGVVRCGFCRADNLVSDQILGQMAAGRSHAVGQIGEQVRNEARALDSSAMAAGGFAIFVAVASPFLAVGLVVIAVIVGSSIEREAKPDASYGFVPVTHASCIAEVRGQSLAFYSDDVGFVDRPIPADMARLPSSQLLGKEYMLSHGEKGVLRRVYRDFLSSSIDRGDLDVNGRIERRAIASLCQAPKNRKNIASDLRFSNATRMHARGDSLFLSAGKQILRVPKAGGAIEVVAEVEIIVSDFWPSSRGVVVQEPGDATGAMLHRYVPGENPAKLALGMLSFTLDGDEVLLGKQDGLYRLGADGAPLRLAETRYVMAIHATPDAIYWAASGGEVHERSKASGQIRRLGKVFDIQDLARVGSQMFIVDKTIGACSIPVAGGEYKTHESRGFKKTTVRTDGQRAYFGLDASVRGGVAAVTGSARTTGEQHYGIDSGATSAFAVDAGEVYFIDGSELLSEPVVAP